MQQHNPHSQMHTTVYKSWGALAAAKLNCGGARASTLQVKLALLQQHNCASPALALLHCRLHRCLEDLRRCKAAEGDGLADNKLQA